MGVLVIGALLFLSTFLLLIFGNSHFAMAPKRDCVPPLDVDPPQGFSNTPSLCKAVFQAAVVRSAAREFHAQVSAVKLAPAQAHPSPMPGVCPLLPAQQPTKGTH